MSTDIEATKRVRDTLDFALKAVLDGFVEANMKGKHGPRWLHYASRSAGQGPNDPLDVYGLCKTILDNWNEVFSARFDRKNMHKARRMFSTVFEARNAVSHLAIPLSDAEALSYLHAMSEVGVLLKAPDAIQKKLKEAYDGQRRSGVAASAEPAARPSGTLGLPSAASPEESKPATSLKPWIEVALPHPDVLANRFKEAEFAADLFAVDSGNVEATSDYATAKGFFEITYLTEGLKRVLETTLQRLSGAGGDPVIGLQTAFGGGKTHTMLAAFHLAQAADIAPLRGVADLAAKAGVATWKPAKVAVFVGTSKGVDTSLILKGGPKVHTLWGYLGWRLAGQAGLDLMAEAEAARTSPASELLVELFRLSGPSLILLDELVAYARQLPDDRFEAFLSFIQSLTEAAKMSPGVLIIGSLPESDLEAGGEKGIAALRRLQTVFGRVHSPWLPASGDETYEIIRRRLFQPLDAEGERARDETVKAFHDLYKKNAAEFPPEAKEARYQELLRISYPIHPELFDRLSKDWASLEKFQRTRGVLRFMANVVGVLWQAQRHDPLITPGRVPIAHEKVRASVLYPLDPAFGAVVDKEVDGDGSLPQRMEANPSRRMSQLQAATRAARAVFLCSAPLVGQPNAGLTGTGLRLACAEPGDQLAIFGEALRELSERATYLYEQAGRYWFSTQPTLNRMADERASAFADHEVDARIVEVLHEDAKTTDRFHKVFPAPDDPINVVEAEALALLILGPSTPHTARGVNDSPAMDAASQTLTRRGASQRRHKNTLIFVAADEALLSSARESMRLAMAWSEIASDRRLQEQLPPVQMRNASEKAKASRDGAAKAVRLAWCHVLWGVKTEDTPAGQAFHLEQANISSRDRAAIPAAVYEKVGPRGESLVKEKLGPDGFWRNIEPLWLPDQPYLAVSEVVEWFAAFPYLPKVRDRVVIEGAIQDGAYGLDPKFGYADAIGADGSYVGLRWAKGISDPIPPTAVLVRAAIAQGATTAGPAPLPPGPGGPGQPPGGAPGGEGGVGEGPIGSTKPRRFYGTVEIDPSRPVKAFEAIINAVVLELQHSPSTKVKLTLEVEAENAEGFEGDDVGVVRDNAKNLKFTPGSYGFD